MTYPRPNTDPAWRVTAQDCVDRAQRVMEVAEMNLDTMLREVAFDCSADDSGQYVEFVQAEEDDSDVSW